MEALAQRLKLRAEALGLRLGITDPDALSSAAFYDSWVDQGFHAEMGYLAEHSAAKHDPASLLPGVKSIVGVALNYYQEPVSEVGDPQVARYALGRDYHKVLRAKLRQLEKEVLAEDSGYRCRICVDSAPLLEREAAHLAGLGWFGKNTCLIDSKTGSWFVLGFLLTDAALPIDQPAVGGCGTCHACIEACPTGAIVQLNGRWVVDSRKCISYLTIEKRSPFLPEEAEAVGSWTFGCDVCQEVCPFNASRPSQPLRSPLTVEPDFLAAKRWPSLVELAKLKEAEWDVLTQGSPVRRAGLSGLQRNAQANLANQAMARREAR